MTTHQIKCAPEYVDALLDGSKTFEVRRNDRGYQRDDQLVITENFPEGRHARSVVRSYECDACYDVRTLSALVSYVYSGDPRFRGIEPGFVVLGLRDVREARR